MSISPEDLALLGPDYFDWHGWPLRQHSLYLQSGKDEFFVRPTDLLVAIDETGTEDLSDPNFPLFGIGGCAVLAGAHEDLIARPWVSLKKRHFSGPDIPLHAAALRNPTQQQVEAVASFFREHLFFRFAAVVNKYTNLPAGIRPYSAVRSLLMKHLCTIGAVVPFERVVLVFEASERDDHLMFLEFNDRKMYVVEADQFREIEIVKFRATKALCYPALEVADFVMHAAGGAVNKKMSGEGAFVRKDFQAVFHSFGAPFSFFMRIDECGFRTTEPPIDGEQ